MATLWITYSWDDNEEGDVDFIAQQLESEGLDIGRDQWDLQAGERLWEQIGHAIQDPDESDAWLIYATQNSLLSEPCREELAYALDRALESREEDYPIIGLFPDDVDLELVPPAITSRLYVSLADEDWKERIVAATEGRTPNISREEINPYFLDIERDWRGKQDVVEMRPRSGTWSPFVVGIPEEEEDEVDPLLIVGPSGGSSGTGMTRRFEPDTDDRWNEWKFIGSNNQATPTESFYLHCETLPSEIVFGQIDGPLYQEKL